MLLALPLTLSSSACDEVKYPNTDSSSQIQIEDLRYHLEYLASDALEGRGTGTPGEEKAAQYIARVFARVGLSPGGEDGTFIQQFPVTVGVDLTPSNGLALTWNGTKTGLSPREDYIPLVFSSSGNAKLPLAFVGYGISTESGYDDYAGIDVSGKAVIALRFSPDGDDPHSDFYPHTSLRRKATAARDHGASAIILVTGPADSLEDKLTKLRPSISGSDAGILVVHMKAAFLDSLLTKQGKDLGAIQSSINEKKAPASFDMSDATADIVVGLVRRKASAKNVIGLLEGSDPALKHQYLVVGSHFDHLGLGMRGSLAENPEGQIHNGADDNASGTSGVLELAEWAAANRDSLKRSTLFMAFSGEEMGLLGSAHYVNNPTIPLDSIVTMINMDMIGAMKDSSVIIYGMGTSSRWPKLIEGVNSDFGLHIASEDKGTSPSDNTSFYLKNIPVLFFFTGVHDRYHRPTDDVEYINFEGEETIVRFVAQTIRAIDQNPRRPDFVSTGGKQAAGDSRGFRVSTGVIPDYAGGADGLKISGVKKDGAAEAAGLQGGDVITGIGGKKVKDIYDYMFALRTLKPNVEVPIIIVREGKELHLRITPHGR